MFGKPVYLVEGEAGTFFATYHDIGVVPGNVQFLIDSHSRIVAAMTLEPSGLSRQGAVALFGHNYLITRWDFVPCRDRFDETELPLYRTSDGVLVYMEYRQLGIALRFSGERVKTIEYSSQPIGFETNPCLTEKQKPRQISPMR
jgi:hypothetical protein